jgi:hypothetical protein
MASRARGEAQAEHIIKRMEAAERSQVRREGSLLIFQTEA